MKTVMLLLLFVLSHCAFAIPNHSLFFLTSSKANIEPLHKNNYVLSLDEPAQYVTYFIGNSKYVAGVISLPSFISLWGNKTLKDNFFYNPPKVAIVMVSKRGKQQFNAIIANPSLVKNVLSYQIAVLNNQLLQVGKLRYIAIIFDNVPENIIHNLELIQE